MLCWPLARRSALARHVHLTAVMKMRLRMLMSQELDPVERELLLRVIRASREALLALQNNVPRPSPCARQFDEALKEIRGAEKFYGKELKAPT